ncbi:hypothetical protein HAX54_017164 [Datura stramonium]|uniref:Uncharacterized protein n=1 Tax=Datura stramonium TaxID=4076 RepID=A0ABS8UM77_DATST|nr:hypothetical protein [Datura stramonium]
MEPIWKTLDIEILTINNRELQHDKDDSSGEKEKEKVSETNMRQKPEKKDNSTQVEQNLMPLTTYEFQNLESLGTGDMQDRDKTEDMNLTVEDIIPLDTHFPEDDNGPDFNILIQTHQFIMKLSKKFGVGFKGREKDSAELFLKGREDSAELFLKVDDRQWTGPQSWNGLRLMLKDKLAATEVFRMTLASCVYHARRERNYMVFQKKKKKQKISEVTTRMVIPGGL